MESGIDTLDYALKYGTSAYPKFPPLHLSTLPNSVPDTNKIKLESSSSDSGIHSSTPDNVYYFTHSSQTNRCCNNQLPNTEEDPKLVVVCSDSADDERQVDRRESIRKKNSDQDNISSSLSSSAQHRTTPLYEQEHCSPSQSQQFELGKKESYIYIYVCIYI